MKSSSFIWEGKKLFVEVDYLARQSLASVFMQYGDTAVLANINVSHTPSANKSFLPFAVNYAEKSYAFSKIPGSFFKREGRPLDRETLISRLIDRPLRPIFHKGFFYDTTLDVMLLSFDSVNESDIVAMNAAACVLSLSGIPLVSDVPWSSRVILSEDGDLISNPTMNQIYTSRANVIVSSVDDNVMMIEGESSEISVESMCEIIERAQQSHKLMKSFFQSFRDTLGTLSLDWSLYSFHNNYDSSFENILDTYVKNVNCDASKKEKNLSRRKMMENILSVCDDLIEESDDFTSQEVVCDYVCRYMRSYFEELLFSQKLRLDQRSPRDIRSITCKRSYLPSSCIHGSAVFTRGNTQALVVTTLGSHDDAQNIDRFGELEKNYFIFHYNFPSFAVGESGRSFGPGRREIGHGFLARKAFLSILPARDEFPYTLRIVSEILESDGSSSMASVCGASLSMMDAGIPIKNHVAGIAMGLVKKGDDYVILSDISGDEDQYGDMDFKIAGTNNGITAIQLDTKVIGVTLDILRDAFHQACDGYKSIIVTMDKEISHLSSTSLKSSVPQVGFFDIKKDKIALLIGSGGRTIKNIMSTCNAKISILEEESRYSLSALNKNDFDKALSMISSIIEDPVVGEKYTGKVVKILDRGGVIVRFFSDNKEGIISRKSIGSKKLKVNSHVKVSFEGYTAKGNCLLSLIS